MMTSSNLLSKRVHPTDDYIHRNHSIIVVTVNRNRHLQRKQSGSLYIIFVTTCERRELLTYHRKRRK